MLRNTTLFDTHLALVSIVVVLVVRDGSHFLVILYRLERLTVYLLLISLIIAWAPYFTPSFCGFGHLLSEFIEIEDHSVEIQDIFVK